MFGAEMAAAMNAVEYDSALFGESSKAIKSMSDIVWFIKYTYDNDWKKVERIVVKYGLGKFDAKMVSDVIK
jgi:hypothetical protein